MSDWQITNLNEDTGTSVGPGDQRFDGELLHVEVARSQGHHAHDLGLGVEAEGGVQETLRVES
jgi:hypothetical protein